MNTRTPVHRLELIILAFVLWGVMFPIGLRIAEKNFGDPAVPWM
ncbi:MAG: hypothetical protein V1715_02540 [bacterium]